MTGSIITEAMLHVKLITDPPGAGDAHGGEFYLTGWEAVTEGRTIDVSKLPEGTKVVGVHYRYIPPPNGAPD